MDLLEIDENHKEWYWIRNSIQQEGYVPGDCLVKMNDGCTSENENTPERNENL